MDEEARICEPGGRGLVFPLFESEQHIDFSFRAAIYVAALLYLFLGVNIVSDTFVSSIEVITSKKKRVRQKGTGRLVTVAVWNGTVANLTLLALGSSAPEILLSLVETMGNGFHAGELGPSTIVGSAAFNLFIIIAVCISSIPSPEIRVIKENGVFIVTAIFSLFAYFWLVLICKVISPDVIEIWEGLVTMAMMPVLVGISYLADIGYWSGGRRPTLAAQRTLPGDSLETDPYASLAMHDPNSPTQQDAAFFCEEDSAPHWTRPAFALDGSPLANEAGVLGFSSETWELAGGLSERSVYVPVVRKGGVNGRVACKFRMEGWTAVPGFDYMAGEGEVVFGTGQDRAFVPVTVLPKRVGEHSDQFQIILEEVEGGAVFDPLTDGGEERCVLTITIQNENEELTRHSAMVRASRWVDGCVNMDNLRLAARSWKDNVVSALYDVGDEDEAPSALDWILHIVSLPWKLSFSILVPPTVLAGGWLCFIMSLLSIGLVTILVIDFAELFGCVTNIADSITAITIVALGTSMPDLFASKAAACQDEYADASIVNVTGSNSVNVFLGIGLPWTMSAVYWRCVGATDEWTRRYGGSFSPGTFVVRSESLAFSVSIFTIAALVALSTISLRRTKLGGELGGPFLPKVMSSLLLCLLWLFYLGLSIWQIIAAPSGFGPQLTAIAIGICILENVLLVLGIFAYLFKGRCSPPQTEGFKGLDDVEDCRGGGAFSEPPQIHAWPPSLQAGKAPQPPFTAPVSAEMYGAHFKGSKHAFSFTSAALVCVAVQRFKATGGRKLYEAGAPPGPPTLTRSSSFHSVDDNAPLPAAAAPQAAAPHSAAIGACNAALNAKSAGARLCGYVGNHAGDLLALSAAGFAAAQVVDSQGGLLRMGRP